MGSRLVDDEDGVELGCKGEESLFALVNTGCVRGMVEGALEWYDGRLAMSDSSTGVGVLLTALTAPLWDDLGFRKVVDGFPKGIALGREDRADFGVPTVLLVISDRGGGFDGERGP